MVSFGGFVKWCLTSKRAVFLLLFQIGYTYYSITPLGQFSLSEVFLLLYSPFLLYSNLTTISPVMKRFCLLLFLCFCSHLPSEIYYGVHYDLLLKRFSLLFFTFVHVLFLYVFFEKDIRFILLVLLSSVVTNLFFKQNIELSPDDLLEENATYFKFRLVPALTGFACSLPFFLNSTLSSQLGILCGLFLLIGGARSGGSILLFASLFSMLFIRFKSFILIHLRVAVIGGLIFLYAIYLVIAHLASTGVLTSGNFRQFNDLANPYNPIELLFKGRSEVFIAYDAFCDRPIWGHSLYSVDTELKYTQLNNGGYYGHSLSEFRSGKLVQIPAHSVIVSSAMKSGFLAFVSYFFLFLFKHTFRALSLLDINKYYLLILVQMLSLPMFFWLSPAGNLRLTYSECFAFVLFVCNKFSYKYSL